MRQRRTSVYTLLVKSEHDFLFIGGKGIFADTGDTEAFLAGGRQVLVRQDDACHRAVAEMVTLNTGTFDDGIVIAHRHGGVTGHPTRVKSEIVPDVLDGDFFGLRKSANT